MSRSASELVPPAPAQPLRARGVPTRDRAGSDWDSSATGGSFRTKRLQELKLDAIAARVQDRQPLSRSDAVTLAQAPFAALAALSEIAQRPGPARLQPLFFVPLLTILRQSGSSKKALQTLCDRTDAVMSHVHGAAAVLAIDEWGDRDNYPKLFDTLSTFSETKPASLHILGPSTADLKKLIPLEDSSSRSALKGFFEALRATGVSTIEGGSNRELHRLAAENGFRSAVAHNLTRTRLALSDGAFQSDEFIAELYDVRAALIKTGALETWFPWSSAVLDTGLPKADAPLGYEFLRALLLGRLLLPEVRYIRASLSLVGIRLAELAYSFGINDFGYVAADTETAEGLGLTPMSSALAELQISHTLSGNIAPFLSTKVTNR